MTRDSIRNAIEFRGIIEGCPDHQWLLTDALYETINHSPSETSTRWVVLSQISDPPRPEAAPENHYEAHDQKHGWTLSASSPMGLAQRIRKRYSSQSEAEP